MKFSSPSKSKLIAACSAGALCAAMAFGMVGCASAPNQTAASSSSSQAQSSAVQQGAQSSSAATSAPTVDSVDVTEQQALNIALDHAKLEESQVQLIKNELDYDDGVAIYEIDFIGQNNMEYEYEISATTGDILSYESESIHS